MLKVQISIALVFAIASQISFPEESTVRLEYRGEDVPLHLKFSSAVRMYTQVPENSPDDRVDIVYAQLNLVQNISGAWYLPKSEDRAFDMNYAEQFLDFLLALKEEAEQRNRRVKEVVACPPDRARPRGDDIYVAFEVMDDAKRGIWEELRQRVERGPFAEGMTRMLRHSGSIHSRSHHYKEIYEQSDTDPDYMLDRICTRMC